VPVVGDVMCSLYRGIEYFFFHLRNRNNSNDKNIFMKTRHDEHELEKEDS
jgi:hypothetical protein